MPTPLTITDAQATAVNTSDTYFQEAFLDGTTASSPLLDPIERYSETSDYWVKIKMPFKAVLAVIMKTLNIPQPLPVTKFTGTVTLAKLTGLGSNGSLVFIDGICTTYTPPT